MDYVIRAPVLSVTLGLGLALLSTACRGERIKPAEVLAGVAPFDSLTAVYIPQPLRGISAVRPPARLSAYIGLQERLRGFQVFYIAPELRLSSEKIPDYVEIREIAAEKDFPDDSAASAFWRDTRMRIEANVRSPMRCFSHRGAKTVGLRAAVWPVGPHGSVVLSQRFQKLSGDPKVSAVVWISIGTDEQLRRIQTLRSVSIQQCD